MAGEQDQSRESNGRPAHLPTSTISQPRHPLEASEDELRASASSDLLRRALEARQSLTTDVTLQHGGPRSLDGIALHAFGLGLVLSASAATAVWLATAQETQLWRAPQFVATLCAFHFLEFYTTARWNTATAKVASFLVFSNGAAYNVAYACAVVEMLLAALLAPRWQAALSPLWVKALGCGMVLLGQGVRSVAMAQAGTNFNHIPVKCKAEGHTLVTSGVYAYLRHPSYFGFFWWAVGTQVLVGNAFCTVAYTIVLWNFFKNRIKGEEKFLVEFFGQDYLAYKERTHTRIPFIR